MAVVSRLRLPVELLHMICSLVARADLPALARADKVCNEICTPLLYRTIDLYDYDTALLCVQTLAPDPTTTFSSRNLSSLVHTFRLHDSLHETEAAHTQSLPAFDALLVHSVTKMASIVHLRCMEARLCSLEIWTRLLSSSRPFLRSVELLLIVPSYPPIKLRWEKVFEKLRWSRVPLPKLTALNVHTPLDLTPSMITLMRGIIATCSSTLSSLAFTTMDKESFQLAVPALDALPALHRLEVQAQALTIPGFGTGSQVRALCIRESFWSAGDTLELSPTQWPALEELECFPGMVPAFLPPDAETRRPISTLRLSHAKYQHNGCEYSTDLMPSWHANLVALSHTAHSATPLKHLAFQVDKLNVQCMQKFLPYYLQHAESLVMVLTTSPKPTEVFALGGAVVAHLPRLRSLLLSDAADKCDNQNGAFRFARDLALQRRWLEEFGRHSATLRHVAFTTEFEWEKGADEAWYPTELPRDRPVDCYDDEDENSEDGLEGDDDSDSD